MDRRDSRLLDDTREEELTREVAALRARLDEAEETLDAIRNGDVDAVVVGGPSGQLVYTLENADRPYRVLIEQMQEGAVTLSGDGAVLYCNQRFATIVGMEREELLGGSIDRFLADDATELLDWIATSDVVPPRSGEFALQAVGGRRVPVNISLVELKVDQDATRVVCAVVTDLTQNRRRSEELAAAVTRLGAEVEERRRVEDSLRLALDAAGMGNWELDLVSGEARRSARHDAIFGHPDRIPRWGLDDAIAQFVPEDRAAVRQAFEDAQATGSLKLERRIVRADDQSTRWINIQGKTFYEHGRAVRISGVVSDVTEQRAIEDQLRQSQKMEAVGQLTGGIAHDFNNLLLVIGGSLDMLVRRIPDDERLTRLIEAAKGGVARGAKLNGQLLAFSRRQDLRYEVLDIGALLPSFEHLLDRAVGESVRVRVESEPGLWLCNTDPHQLETAILNLAINARDAMPEGGRLTLRTENRVVDEELALRVDAAAGEYVVISVTDTGSGMPAEVVAHAFEPFFTTKEVGKGTGLGLSQVYGFAKQSDGFVTIDSEAGRGTAVLIHLPRTRQAVSAPPEAGTADAMESGKEVVLLVEDDPDVRAVTSAMLRDLGYEVLEASTARAALKVIDGGTPVDLVFTDVIMPFGMSGIELAQELGKRSAPPRILLTSGYTAQRVIPDELGTQLRLLRKPYTQPELSKAVREAFQSPKIWAERI